MNKEVKFNLDEDILFQIAMMTYSECNSEIATIYDHLGEEYGYSDLQDAKEYELKYEKDLLEKAVKQLQEENQELKKQIEADYTSVYLKACEDTKDKYKTQQKEFIKYLEDGIKEAKDDRKSEWDYEIKFEINGYIDAYEEILLKYKEIVGDISE